MTSRTAWTAGNLNSGAGLTWQNAFGSADLTSLAAAAAVLSSNADIGNDTGLDQLADFALSITTTSNPIAAGSAISLYLFQKSNTNGGTVYGDGSLPTPGTQVAGFVTGGIYPVGIIPLWASTRTTMTGFVQGIIIPPGLFRWALLNNGIAFSATAANNVAQYRTYNQNLNN